MYRYTIVFGILLCMMAVNGRHYAERKEREGLSEERGEQIENFRKVREHGASQMRHRRKRWQMNYGYNYPPPPNPYYPDDRRDYDRNQQDVIPHIVRLLDEISSYVKRPPAPPVPVYVPYPVPYPVLQYCSCPGNKPNVTSRFPDMSDPNQNWGFVVPDKKGNEDKSDGARPVSFEPITPQQPTFRPPPKVEHGSSQAAREPTTQAPQFKIPQMCDAAVLSCCRPTDSRQQQRQCFIELGCGTSYGNGDVCTPESISAVLQTFSKAYSPVN